MKKLWDKEFTDPGKSYRGKPFWAWNGKLEESELRRQIGIMKKMGLGGFFMHSRTGLVTPYLSQEWHTLIAACAEEAKNHDMEAWLYDEDRWPSGAAGGLVTRNPKYRQTRLKMELIKDEKSLRWSADTIAVFSAKINGGCASEVKRLNIGKRPDALLSGHMFLVFRVTRSECSSWYNGYAYLDTLRHEAVKKFIKTTHDSYKKNVGSYFKKTIPGIFTDEPNYGPWFKDDGQTKTWTSSLPRVFKARYGYDIVHNLPELFFDIEGKEVSRVRFNYFDCITFLFVDAFARQIGHWCSKAGILSTGHVLGEGTLQEQAAVVGSAMRFHEHMQSPGMDILTECRREYHAAKQVSSAARQFGRKWRLTETYGCTGWDFPFAGHKAIGDWQAALGINLRCQHLALYTMEGEAKRDYPASIFFQSPWWESYEKVENYFARVNFVMTHGEEVRDLLVIHPVESMWTICRPGWENDKKVPALERAFASIRDFLLMEHIDFDYGDEDIICRHGSVSSRGSASFVVGKAAYKAVLVPEMITIRKTTIEFLKKFRASGGLVVFVGNPPAYVDAVESDVAVELAKKCVRVPAVIGDVSAALAPKCRNVSITDEKGSEIPSVLSLLREDKDAAFLFLCNTGHKKAMILPELRDVPVRERKESFDSVLVRAFAKCKGVPLELNPDTGSITVANASQQKGVWEIKTDLPALGSRIFMAFKQRRKVSYPKAVKLREKSKTAISSKNPAIVLSELNNAVLDRPRFSIGGGQWEDAEDVLRVDALVRDKIGVQRRGGIMVQPWAERAKSGSKNIHVKLSYRFEVSEMPENEMFLALEQPDCFRVSLNGHDVDVLKDCGWWVDSSLRKLELNRKFLKSGINEIILTCDYHESCSGLENIFLLGSFGVKLNDESFTLTRAPSCLELGDWCGQGMPFYSGSVTYLFQVECVFKPDERVFIVVPEYEAVAARVFINEQQAGVIAWAPNELDITDLLSKGKNALKIELLGHRRNSHGPLHNTQKRLEWTGPAEFVTTDKEWQNAYNLVPCGLMKAPFLSVRHV